MGFLSGLPADFCFRRSGILRWQRSRGNESLSAFKDAAYGPGKIADLYELLGVQSNATQAQIKTAYYRKSFLYHPDRNAGSVEAADLFIHITQAYQVLGSLSLRKKYDRGLLTQKDISNAKKPPGKSKAAAAAQTVSKKKPVYTSGYPSGKPIFNFDEFYRAHYGEQLERERLMRLKQQELQKQRENQQDEQYKFLENFLFVLFLSGAVILLRYQ
uniref:DnaJ heat shock protein family (Hsp40) member C30 n=1 Tax=Pseudonaja textilis TaxID=8673 RepID=A0A670YSA9_PSETE